jgi:hypothetical protein
MDIKEKDLGRTCRPKLDDDDTKAYITWEM